MPDFDLEKKVYKDDYSKLNHKVYVEKEPNSEDLGEPRDDNVAQPSKLMSNPDALTREQKNNRALAEMTTEFDEEDTSSALSDDSVDDFVSDDVLFEPR